MLLIISPAKKLDLSEESRYSRNYSLPGHMPETLELVKELKKKSAKSIGKLMHLSESLAELNYERYQQFEAPFTPENAKQALMTFKGDVYLSFELEQYDEEDFAFAQKHLRILSGLYGLLRPLDLIQPYRLEMGTKLTNKRGKDLYAFWGERISQAINEALTASGSQTLVNLASNEYFKAVKPDLLSAEVISPQFKDARNGGFKTLFLYAKQARGAMCDYAIKEKISNPEDLKHFQGMGYQYNEGLSDAQNWVFTR